MTQVMIQHSTDDPARIKLSLVMFSSIGFRYFITKRLQPSAQRWSVLCQPPLLPEIPSTHLFSRLSEVVLARKNSEHNYCWEANLGPLWTVSARGASVAKFACTTINRQVSQQHRAFIAAAGRIEKKKKKMLAWDPRLIQFKMGIRKCLGKMKAAGVLLTTLPNSADQCIKIWLLVPLAQCA